MFHHGDPLAPFRARASERGALAFSVEKTLYDLQIRELTPLASDTVAFLWEQHGGQPLPELQGTIRAQTFGWITLFRVRARYALAGDIVSRLLDDAVGGDGVSIAFGRLRKSLRALLRKSRPQAKPALAP